MAKNTQNYSCAIPQMEIQESLKYLTFCSDYLYPDTPTYKHRSE